MKIEEVRVSLLRAPFVEKPGFFGHYARDRENRRGRGGDRVGASSASAISSISARGFRTVATCIEEVMKPRILGRDASEIEAIWRDLWTVTIADGRGGAPVLALSAIDVALWDIVGKRAGLPLHRLWGPLPKRGSRLRVGLLARARRRGDGGEGAPLRRRGVPRGQDAGRPPLVRGRGRGERAHGARGGRPGGRRHGGRQHGLDRGTRRS